MSAPVINSVSPASGAPGAAITLTGSGFTAAARVGCPSFVPTTFVSSTQLTAAIPQMEGAPGTSQAIGIFVLDTDGVSAVTPFTVWFPRTAAQSWTTIAAVCAEIPGFIRGNANLPDSTITGWMQSVSQSVTSVLLRRGLPLDPSQWQQADQESVAPSAAATLELIARYGAAARLSAAVAAQFTGGANALSSNLSAAYNREFQLLSDGAYDKLFLPAAATEISGQSLGFSATGAQQPECPKFRMDKRF